VLVPDWAALQSEFLGILKSGDLDLVAATRERLKVSGMPEALIAQVERSGATHPVFTVSAPLGGVIQTLDVRAGMTLAQGMTLARINGLETVWVEAALPELQAGLVRPGQPVEVRLAAYPGEVARGRVIAILPEANAESRTLRVRAELPNREARYRPGMFAQVRFAAGESASVLFVPSEAVIRTGRRDMVLAVGDDGAFHPVEVRTGREGDGRTAILGGLAEGQKVVASGQFLIDSEASLRGALPRLGEPAGATSTPDTSHGNPKAGKP
jgi:Cu(I)/Ag(I) efflux system membrane fusion protein